MNIARRTPPAFFAASGSIHFRSVDGAESWQPVDAFEEGCFYCGPPSCEYSWGYVAIGSNDPDVLWFGVDSWGVTYYFYRSNDGGATWELVRIEHEQSWWRIAVDPTDAKRVYISNGPVYRTDDGGETWAEVSPPGFATHLEFDPHDSNLLYSAIFFASGPQSVNWSPNRGNTWFPVDVSGLPNDNLRSFAVDPVESGVLYMGFETQGVYRTTVDVVSVPEASENEVRGGRTIGALSAPLVTRSPRFALRVGLNASAQVEVSIYDAPGRRRERVFSGRLVAGDHEIAVEAEIPPGVYFLRASANDDVATCKFVLAP
jgi:hypothetical protein